MDKKNREMLHASMDWFITVSDELIDSSFALAKLQKGKVDPSTCLELMTNLFIHFATPKTRVRENVEDC